MKHSNLIAFVWLCGVLNIAACRKQAEHDRGGQTKPMTTIHNDSTGLAKKILLPHGATDIRWIEMNRGNASGRIGPTDTRLCVSFHLNAEKWRALAESFGKPFVRREYALPEDRNALFPAATLRDAFTKKGNEHIWIGEIYDPSSIATSWYTGVLAFRANEIIYMEFVSN